MTARAALRIHPEEPEAAAEKTPATEPAPEPTTDTDQNEIGPPDPADAPAVASGAEPDATEPDAGNKDAPADESSVPPPVTEPAGEPATESAPDPAAILEVSETITVRRKLRERFLSMPWKPWVTNTTMSHPMRPRTGDVWKTAEGWICNSMTAEQLRAAMARGKATLHSYLSGDRVPEGLSFSGYYQSRRLEFRRPVLRFSDSKWALSTQGSVMMTSCSNYASPRRLMKRFGSGN